MRKVYITGVGFITSIGNDRAAVVRQMREDEERHGTTGRELGGRELPLPVKAAN